MTYEEARGQIERTLLARAKSDAWLQWVEDAKAEVA